jgi:hypothetical protein
MINEENDEEAPKAGWLHDQDLNLGGINKHLNTLAEALKQGIGESKKELARMINAQSIVRK